jgi:hypothetical protein
MLRVDAMLSGITMLSGILQVLDCCLSFVAGTVPTLCDLQLPCPWCNTHCAVCNMQRPPCNAAAAAVRTATTTLAVRRSGSPTATATATIQPSATAGAIAAQRAAALSHSCGQDCASMGCGPPPAAAMLPCLAVQSEEWENGDAGGFVCYMADEVGARIHLSRTAWYPARRGPLHMRHAACSGAERFSGSAESARRCGRDQSRRWLRRVATGFIMAATGCVAFPAMPSCVVAS